MRLYGLPGRPRPTAGGDRVARPEMREDESSGRAREKKLSFFLSGSTLLRSQVRSSIAIGMQILHNSSQLKGED